jgi:hypothetical protein
MRDPDMTWLQRHIGRAKGVLIAPQIVKAGWIFGGSGGRAVLFARNEQTGRWSGPAFYNVGAASVGFQAGVSVSETVTLVMTTRGINSLLATRSSLWRREHAAGRSQANSDVTPTCRVQPVQGVTAASTEGASMSPMLNRTYSMACCLISFCSTAHNAQADRLAAELGARPREKSVPLMIFASASALVPRRPSLPR